jgi:hypothetical protein
MHAVYLAKKHEDVCSYDGYVFRQNRFFLQPEKGYIRSLFLDRWSRVYGLQIRKFSTSVKKCLRRMLRNTIEKTIRDLFAETVRIFPFFEVHTAPSERIFHNKFRDSSSMEQYLKQTIAHYSKKGFNLSVPPDEGDYLRKEKGSLLDVIAYPLY